MKISYIIIIDKNILIFLSLHQTSNVFNLITHRFGLFVITYNQDWQTAQGSENLGWVYLEWTQSQKLAVFFAKFGF